MEQGQTLTSCLPIEAGQLLDPCPLVPSALTHTGDHKGSLHRNLRFTVGKTKAEYRNKGKCVLPFGVPARVSAPLIVINSLFLLPASGGGAGGVESPVTQ